MMEFKRKIYKRGSSYETTIPMPMLFSLDLDRKNVAIFRFDKKSKRWYVDFDEFKSRK